MQLSFDHYKPLEHDFYEQDTVQVAQALLGTIIIRQIQGQIRAGKIVETEAYRCDDAACHAYKGVTQSNKALFGPVGHAYIYFIYGNHFCFNIVCRTADVKAGGVLVRAIEPIKGIEAMIDARGGISGYTICNGPGKLTQALGITKALYGTDLTKPITLFISKDPYSEPHTIIRSKRIGISKSKDLDWRFYIANNRWVSRK